ncbi:hypothetical protein [Streptomyces sp. Tue6028]|uniref:hypothetical protein n=1 Tax=Streptomyces sp. Tue6028 TaxID=2036037 RepID=UPI003D74D031
MSRDRERSRRTTRNAAQAVTAAVVLCLLTSCSSDDPAQDKERQRTYCSRLGAWQEARDAAAGNATGVDESDAQGSDAPGTDDASIAGDLAVASSRVLNREKLDRTGSHILDDTVLAVGGDPAAESRAVSYCDDSGFETMVER